MTLLVQDYLKTHTLNQLKADHGVNHRISEDMFKGTKFSLNYDMIEASNTDPLASQCRGVILGRIDMALDFDADTVVGETGIMCRPMDRFFNNGQECAANIDFEAKGTKFYEKLDGTMCALYYDWQKHEWHISTRSVSEANLPIDGFDNLTFRGLFEKAVKETTGEDFADWIGVSNLSREMTYVFELCTLANRIVVEHFDNKVHFLAVRNCYTGEEYAIEDPGHAPWGVPVCQTYDLSSLEDMINFVSDRNPIEHEGVVAVDKNFNRVKVKDPAYLALSRVKDSALRSPRALVQLCLLGKLDDALPLLPDHIVERAHNIEEALRTFIRDSNGMYNKVVHNAREMCRQEEWDHHDEKVFRKAIALSAQEEGAWMPYIMLMFTGQIRGFNEFIQRQVDPNTGEYKKGFLDSLLEKLGV